MTHISEQTDDGEARMCAPGSPGRRGGIPGRLCRIIVGLLALAALVQIICVFTPLGDRVAGYLIVSEEPRPADFIVCLGGRDQRLIWAVDLYHRGIAPRVVVSNAPGAAEKMRDILVLCGVPADRILVDSASRSTADHPGCVAALTGANPAEQRFVVVTDKYHTRRVAACFRHGGYRRFQVYTGRVVASYGESISGQTWRQRFTDLPEVVYEYAGLLQYWLRGHI